MNSIIEKVKRLQALSKSSNLNEAMNAAAIANRLIDEHRLTEEDLDDNPMVDDLDPVYETGKITTWKNNLVILVAGHYGCAVYIAQTYPNGRKYSSYHLVGKKSDIEIAKYMIIYFMNQCDNLSGIHARGKGRIYANSFCLGFVSGVVQKLNESRKDIESKSGSDIIHLDSRKMEAANFLMKKENLKKIDQHSNARYDSSGYNNGFKSGKGLEVNSGLNRKKNLLGN